MKNTKRILGVALALIMIFNVFAVGAFAAFPEDTLVKLMIKTDKATYAAGETVKITISEQSNGELVNMAIGGVYDIKYPTGSLEPISDAADGLVANHGFVAIQAGYGDGYSNFVNPGYAVEDGYSSIALSIYDDGTAFDATAGVDLFTFEMKVPETCADGTYKIEFNSAAYENYEAFSNDPTLGMGLYGMDPTALGYSAAVMYEFGSCEITVGEEAPVEYDLKHIENQWRESVNVEGAYDIGVKFGFDVSDIDIQFEGTRSTNVARVGAEIYDADGNKIDKVFESEFVYEVGTEYHYRVIIEGLAKDDTAKYTVKPYLVYTDESLPVVYGEVETVCAADVIPQ